MIKDIGPNLKVYFADDSLGYMMLDNGEEFMFLNTEECKILRDFLNKNFEDGKS